jgi:hypothetical protein
MVQCEGRYVPVCTAIIQELGYWIYLVYTACSIVPCQQVDVKKATPKPDGIGGMRGGRGGRGGRGRGRGGRDTRVKGKGEQAGVPRKTKCFKLLRSQVNALNLYILPYK